MTVIKAMAANAADKSGMTLDELAAFVEAARSSGIPGDAQVTAVVKIGSARVKKIEIKG
jgi:hypothetical protein